MVFRLKYSRTAESRSLKRRCKDFAKSFCNHSSIGVAKPRFLRWTISAGRTALHAFLCRYFCVPPLIFKVEGRDSRKSTRSWSKKGTRISIELAMLILSLKSNKLSARLSRVSMYNNFESESCNDDVCAYNRAMLRSDELRILSCKSERNRRCFRPG